MYILIRKMNFVISTAHLCDYETSSDVVNSLEMRSQVIFHVHQFVDHSSR